MPDNRDRALPERFLPTCPGVPQYNVAQQNPIRSVPTRQIPTQQIPTQQIPTQVAALPIPTYT